MTRKNFPRSVIVACIKDATREVAPGVVDQYCEECHQPTKGRFEIDHIDADGLTGQPVRVNARLLCKPCHKEKTASDVEKIARAKRREAAHLHAPRPTTGRKLQGPSFPQSNKRKAHPMPMLPPRSLYEANHD